MPALRDDLAVALDRQPLAGELARLEQGMHGQRLFEAFRLAVDDELDHGETV